MHKNNQLEISLTELISENIEDMIERKKELVKFKNSDVKEALVIAFREGMIFAKEFNLAIEKIYRSQEENDESIYS